MIELTKYEKRWILICKGHYRDKYEFKGSWANYLKPVFKEIYGWGPDEDNNYRDYLYVMFNKLLDIQLKISDDGSGSNHQIKEVFHAAFGKSIRRTGELPIERAIAELCGLIQCNQVIENSGTPNEYKRYDLENLE